ncbi:MAG TPA: hypothetical protein VLI04_01965, partial [Nocardioidaceae bacterium]|nr:hypothetical protein [Nocardioidaceae bacterium]
KDSFSAPVPLGMPQARLLTLADPFQSGSTIDGCLSVPLRDGSAALVDVAKSEVVGYELTFGSAMTPRGVTPYLPDNDLQAAYPESRLAVEELGDETTKGLHARLDDGTEVLFNEVNDRSGTSRLIRVWLHGSVCAGQP